MTQASIPRKCDIRLSLVDHIKIEIFSIHNTLYTVKSLIENVIKNK